MSQTSPIPSVAALAALLHAFLTNPNNATPPSVEHIISVLNTVQSNLGGNGAPSASTGPAIVNNNPDVTPTSSGSANQSPPSPVTTADDADDADSNADAESDAEAAEPADLQGLPIAAAAGTSVFVSNPPQDIGKITGFVCANCKVYNLVRPATETWYCVTKGRRVGVYKGIHAVRDWVLGFSGFGLSKHPNCKEALEAWADAYEAGNIAFPDDVDYNNPGEFGAASVPAVHV
ncbi:hypothetical protein CC1G_12793 [Coprinopsis cinerea okayama7|uniref:Uncharacterized protein n=1 Tax=Coprinopsis cinerea (strain Okayama-7 / 130 / ATCC MYA-4618 / FGSC 9003) TaxID=240176 RepID=A8P3G2_COPC7|nr:hypothetical protein CC1G_12793 [Coprinopsis cinerea okayama7\|eukprot:XP_001838542.1 hypothetical protein CC1G_12793 [Coprinopsis cinerea okayama7\